MQGAVPVAEGAPDAMASQSLHTSGVAEGSGASYACREEGSSTSGATSVTAKPTGGVGSLCTAGKAACENPWYYAECARKVACERDDFTRFLSENCWNVIPSQTNFVFAQKPGMSGEEVYQRIKQEGILVRHFSTKGIEDYVRITIGTKKQMNELKRVIGRLQSV